MRAKLFIGVLCLFVAIICGVFALFEKGEPFTSIISSAFFGVSLSLLVDLFLSHGKIIWIIFKALKLKRLRVSFAYLIRIKDSNSNFLFVPNKRVKGMFQPPGGVFECYEDKVFDKFDLLNDEAFSDSPKKDLRKILSNPKKLASLVAWFYSRRDRECCPHREFKEELLDTGVLDKDNFQNTSFIYHKTVTEGLSYSPHFHCDELKIFEIFEVVLEVGQQKEIDLLKNAPNEGSKFIFLDKGTIGRDGFDGKNSSILLGTQSKHILDI